MMRFWNNFYHARTNPKYLKAKQFKNLWEEQIKGTKQNSQNRLRSLISGGGEPQI